MWCIIKYFLRCKKIGPENREKEDTQYNETKPLYAPDKLYKIDISFETNNVLIIYYFDILNILLSNICRKWTCKKLPIFAKYENIKFLLKYMNRISCQSHIKLLPTLLLLKNIQLSYIIHNLLPQFYFRYVFISSSGVPDIWPNTFYYKK